jgi:hypothetical protein
MWTGCSAAVTERLHFWKAWYEHDQELILTLDEESLDAAGGRGVHLCGWQEN